jgi:predicted phosphodiesterase
LTRTLVVSDLHLGGSSGAAVLERPAAREALFAALDDIDRLVLLGDLLELRHGPRHEAIERARPFLRELGRAFAGREVVVLAGNHDHALIERWRRLSEEAGGRDGMDVGVHGEPGGTSTASASVALEQRMDAAEASSMLAAIAEWAEPARVSAAYPGLWLRDDVYATHGHYLDCHLSVPTMECLGIGMTARALGKRTSELESVVDYEGVTAPVYAWIDAVARQAPTGSALNGQSTVRMWRALGGDRNPAERGGGAAGRREGGAGADGASAAGDVAVSTGVAGLAALGPALRRRALASALPVAVAALNRFGLGSFRADISAPELRRAGLRAMGEVVDRLGVGDKHVIFGHTHRAGPRPGDDPGEWLAPGGARLINTGCWTYDAYFLRGAPGESPYWPGGAVLVEDEVPPTPPRLLRLLDSVPAEELSADRA